MTDASAEKSARKKGRLLFFLAQLPYLILYVAAIALAAMTDSEPTEAAARWIWFIPAVALVSIYGGWQQGNAGTTMSSRGLFLLRQVLHWAALAVVIHFLFREDLQHFLNAETDGFVTIFLLGLTAMLAGVHADWKMGLFGAFLILTGVLIGWFDDNALKLTLGGIAIVAVVLTLLVRFKFMGKKTAKGADGGKTDAADAAS
jgi:hypothetical protein